MNNIINIKYKVFIVIIPLLLSTILLYGKEIEAISFSNQNEEISIGDNVWILKDLTGKFGIEDIIHSTNFRKSEQKVPTFWFTSATIWFKFKLKNNSLNNYLLLKMNTPLIDEAELFYLNENNQYESVSIGQNNLFNNRKYKQPEYIYDLNIKPTEIQTFYLRIKSYDQIQIPLKILTPNQLFTSCITYNYVFGIYCGVMLIMIFYNLFIYFSVKDKSYLYYVLYVIAVTLTQTTFQGYTFKYLWPSHPQFETQSILIMSVFVGFTSVEFLRVLLKTKINVPKLDRVFVGAYFVYGFITILILLKLYQISWILILALVSPLSLFMLFVGAKMAYKGSRSAKFFTASWSIFLIGVFVYALKDFGILPHNNLTIYTMPVGSAIETVLLSFALAARINDYKKEKEISQLQAYQALEEKEQLMREQNIMLEEKVTERTLELNSTLHNLKETQSQLVDAEKMASLGQLTAGIAHEINNPINFVSSNISPLKQDINDLKTIIDKYSEINTSNFDEKIKEVEALKSELDYNFLTEELNSIISSIENGANRTTEIVRSLRNFSRLDESDLMLADINEGIESALVLLRSEHSGIKMVKKLNPLPKIECYPGKLNQVFVNLLNNAIHAVNDKKNSETKRIIEIKTFIENETIGISIKDNGIGMNKETQNKIFDPFFTTKEVGKGTGLGLSIVYRIIESHHGTIKVESKENKGTVITLNLPKHQKQ